MGKEHFAGGFSKSDGTIQFYTRINALLKPSDVVLDVGAGRGAQILGETSQYKQQLITLRGRVALLTGLDVDDAVLSNPYVDRADVVRPHGAWPYDDCYFDLVYADWVLEHLDSPQQFFSEAFRVLKPGGWLCARTPNRWGITGVAKRLIPTVAQATLLKFLTPARREEDIFPTHYRANSLPAIRHLARREFWEDYSYIINGDPPYVGRFPVLQGLVKLYWRAVPSALYTEIIVCMRRR